MTKEDKNEDYKKLIEKVDKVVNEKKIDVNVEEDLCVGIMNLIGIEEHLFFTAEKTGKKDIYYPILNEVRKMRVELLRKLIKDYEGEVWCTSKHLLAASMRMSEVGTKYLKEGKDKEAYEFFEKAYNLYNLFWGLNMKMIDTKTIKDKGILTNKEIEVIDKQETLNLSSDNKSSDKTFFSKLGDALKKAIDCCKE